uniref:Uncharacterized protein n=1 Tax=Timema tahoe TaxID=61484 RepID=A0A7R9P231_9NEOP|nr:unnamed protein product [Timema tahoe]
MCNPLLDHSQCDWHTLTGVNKFIVPFVACGDLSMYDSDTTYPLKIEERPYVQLEPTQSPISPPYVQSVALKKQGLGKSGIYFTVKESEQ